MPLIFTVLACLICTADIYVVHVCVALVVLEMCFISFVLQYYTCDPQMFNGKLHIYNNSTMLLHE